jgi:xanthine/uracil permease
MTPLVLMAGMIVVPPLLILVLRVNAAILFLSLCLGSVLVQFVGNDASSFVNLFSSSKLVSGYGAQLVLLLLPAAFTMIVMIGTVRGKFRTLLNLLPAVAVGVVGLLLAEPLFSPGLRNAVAGTQAWQNLQQLQVLIVSASTIVSLLFLWLQRPGHFGRDAGGKHGRH